MKPSSAHTDSLPYTVALTGGIASGKTLVSDEFTRLGVPVIDTDVIAHEIVEPGQPALAEIESAFGSDVIAADGRLKRSELRKLIFSDLCGENPKLTFVSCSIFANLHWLESRFSLK